MKKQTNNILVCVVVSLILSVAMLVVGFLPDPKGVGLLFLFRFLCICLPVLLVQSLIQVLRLKHLAEERKD